MTSQLIGPDHESKARALVALLRDQARRANVSLTAANRASVNLMSVSIFMYQESKARNRVDRTALLWADAHKTLNELADRIEDRAGYLK